MSNYYIVACRNRATDALIHEEPFKSRAGATFVRWAMAALSRTRWGQRRTASIARDGDVILAPCVYIVEHRP